MKEESEALAVASIKGKTDHGIFCCLPSIILEMHWLRFQLTGCWARACGERTAGLVSMLTQAMKRLTLPELFLIKKNPFFCSCGTQGVYTET